MLDIIKKKHNCELTLMSLNVSALTKVNFPQVNLEKMFVKYLEVTRTDVLYV